MTDVDTNSLEAPHLSRELQSSGRDDVLTAFLAPCRVHCGPTQPWRLIAPFGLEFSKTGPGFVVVLDGECLVRASGMSADLPLRRHGLVVITRESRLIMRDSPETPVVAADQILQTAGETAHAGVQTGGDGSVTRLLWGTLKSGDDYTRHALALLPSCLSAHGDGPEGTNGLGSLLSVLISELEHPRPGGQLLVDHVLEASLVYTLRAVSLQHIDVEGLVPGLGVPGLGMALAAMHANPERDWSVGRLASLAGLSRSKFALRFVEVLGCPPFEYLRDLRMRLAGRLLLETELAIKEITARVGYATEASFSKAFSGWCGCAPGAYRRQRGSLTAE